MIVKWQYRSPKTIIVIGGHNGRYKLPLAGEKEFKVLSSTFKVKKS